MKPPSERITWLAAQKVTLELRPEKAFCEPGNADFCPPLDWVQALLPSIPGAEFVVSRKPENGRNLSFVL